MSAPVPLQDGRWELRWSSEAGKSYTLQRSRDLRRWMDVKSVTATGALTKAEDLPGPGMTSTFWRVRAGGGVADDVAPEVTLLGSRFVTRGGQMLLELSLRATDNIGVIGVNITEAGVSLGAASSDDDVTWVKLIPVDPNAASPRHFKAEARDAAGNAGGGPGWVYDPATGDLPFVPLESTGPGTTLLRWPSGKFCPFRYEPAGDSGLQLAFPTGAWVGGDPEQPVITYNELSLSFGSGSPLQFNLGAAKTAGVRGVRGGSPQNAVHVVLPNGSTAQLPTGALDQAAVAALLGLDPSDGVPLRLFDKFNLTWLSGELVPEGFRNSSFGLSELGLPLPPESTAYAQGITPLGKGNVLNLPLTGEWEIPGGKLKVTRARPIRLLLSRDYEVSLKGPARLDFGDAGEFEVQVELDKSRMGLRLSTVGQTFGLLQNLAQALPPDPTECLGTGAAESTLDAATACLADLRTAYELSTQAALALRPPGPGDATVTRPPLPLESVMQDAVYNAWLTLLTTKFGNLIAPNNAVPARTPRPETR